MGHEHTQLDIACRHIADGERPILYVWRYSDGQFGMNCGYDDHPAGTSYVPLCRNCVVEKMPEFDFFQQLPPGQEASRESQGDRVWRVQGFQGEDK